MAGESRLVDQLDQRIALIRIQAGVVALVEQSSTIKCHKSRAMRHRVRICTERIVVVAMVTDRHRAALCQVYDSIFMDLPMSRVKFNVNSEYAYIANFKILQSEPSEIMLERD